MEQIIIQVKDQKKAKALIDFLQTLDFVDKVQGKPVLPSQKTRRARNSDFFALAGLWAGRDISSDALRRKAWPERK